MHYLCTWINPIIFGSLLFCTSVSDTIYVYIYYFFLCVTITKLYVYYTYHNAIMLDKCCHHRRGRQKERILVRIWNMMCFALIAIFHLKWSHYMLNSWTLSINPLTHVWCGLNLFDADNICGEIGLQFSLSFFPLCLIWVSGALFRTRKFLFCIMRESYFSNSDHVSRMVSFVGILYSIGYSVQCACM